MTEPTVHITASATASPSANTLRLRKPAAEGSSDRLPIVVELDEAELPVNDSPVTSDTAAGETSSSSTVSTGPTTPSESPRADIDCATEKETLLLPLPVDDPGVDVRGTSPNSRIYDLWFKSRLKDPDCAYDPHNPPGVKHVRQEGTERPLSKHHLQMAWELLFLLRPYACEDLKCLSIQDGVCCVMILVLDAVVPVADVWATSAILNMIQQAFEQKTPSLYQVAPLLFFNIFLGVWWEIHAIFENFMDKELELKLNRRIERQAFASQLAAPLSDHILPDRIALWHEAIVFSGDIRARKLDGTRIGVAFPRDRIQLVFGTSSAVLGVFSHMTLLAYTFASTKRPGAAVSFRDSRAILLLLTLSLAPSILGMVSTHLNKQTTASINNRLHFFWRRETCRLDTFVDDLSSKQESIIYGLSSWILRRWDAEKARGDLQVRLLDDPVKGRKVCTALLQSTAEALKYLLLMRGSFSSILTLGSVELLQSSARTILRTIKEVQENFDSIVQTVFFYAAYVEATTQQCEGKRGQAIQGTLDGDKRITVADKVRTRRGMLIEAKNLSLTYPKSEKPALKDVSLTIKPGETLAIVGTNGGGKTTLVKALLGLYPHSGSILVDGVPMKQLDLEEFHSRTACLFQDFGRYAFTLRENIAMGSIADISQDEMLTEAAGNGGAGEIIEQHGLECILDKRVGSNDGNDASEASNDLLEAVKGDPTRYNGVLGRLRSVFDKTWSAIFPSLAQEAKKQLQDAGEWTDWYKKNTQLSGGQWQRVALSRAFLRAKQADLVVFDEPSSALDPKAEYELFQRIHALSQMGHKATTIFISHRFCTVRKADRIAFVHDGVIAELGTHDELMALEGKYAKFFNLQKEAFDE